jgi:hypothetical protein
MSANVAHDLGDVVARVLTGVSPGLAACRSRPAYSSEWPRLSTLVDRLPGGG